MNREGRDGREDKIFKPRSHEGTKQVHEFERRFVTSWLRGSTLRLRQRSLSVWATVH
jgi:hypothetical protein